MSAFLDIGILAGPAVIAVIAAAAIVGVLLVVIRPSRKWGRSRWIVTALVSAVAGALAGLALTWLLGDVNNAFGVDLTLASRAWIAAGCAGIAVAVTSLWRPTWKRAIAVPLSIVLFVVTAAMGVNIAFGQYPTIRSVLGMSAFEGDALPPLSTPASDRPTIADWTAPAGMPTAGTVASVTIPATVSTFVARDAVVYLPPAALTTNPPLLPVMIMLSGQPGSPEDPLTTAHLRESLDAYAAAHQGLAPIVVSPDQLGAPGNNPMCVDSPLGNSATYLTVDVVTWIKANLPVLDAPDDWGIGGLSQGGTCSIQLGAAHPELFSAILDASGEEFPTLGDEATTIQQGFGGDADAYAAAHPAAILAANAPYTDTFAVFGVGSEDTAFLPGVQKLYQDAKDAGMDATYIEAQGSAHDATTWSYVFQQGIGLIADHWGLDR
ncbi:alpha/beta hydrolase [Microbacterium sp. P05]|uniref:alpha/beta hydrolase n=1 Tax=Microbacterium sp. P05 TaxID=3366948 RepID=UPI00374615B1